MLVTFRSKLYSLLSASVLFTTVASSQVMGAWEPLLNVGVKAGAGFSSLSQSAIDTKPAILAGIYVQRRLIGRFGIRAEAFGNITSYTTKYPAAFYTSNKAGKDTVSKGEFSAVHLSIPLLAEFYFSKNLRIIAGPQFNYLASLTDKNGVYTSIYGDDKLFNKTDFAAVAGVELKLMKRLDFGARMVLGLTDLNNSNYYLVPKAWRSSGAQLSLSYRVL